jgi:hypothetical protein
MRISGALVLALIAVGLAASGCRRPENAERADLCGDLAHLRVTMLFLTSPPEDVSVGEIRADLDKLDPTFGAVSASRTVPQDVVDRLVADHEAYRAVIDGIGDDDRFSTVRADAVAPAQSLAQSFGTVVKALGCDGAPAS